MSIMICEGLFPNSELTGFNLAREVFAKVLPTTIPWSVDYSSYGSYFDCSTKVQLEGVNGLIGLFVRFEITDDLEVVVTKISGSRKHSTKNWSGKRYTELRNLAFKQVVKSWLIDLKAKGVRVIDEVTDEVAKI